MSLTSEFKAGLYDTQPQKVSEATWEPYVPGAIPREEVENDYISSLFSPKPQSTSYLPMESIVVNELMNRNSRAHMQERWQERLNTIKLAKERFIEAELDDLEGRRAEDARAEGLFRWKMAVTAMERRRRHRRWVGRGGQAKMQMRRARRVEKQMRLTKSLRKMELLPAANQYIPAPSHAA